MTWEQAFEILKPIPTDDYIGGAWNSIRYHKCKALFELAQQVKQGVIVELGTFRGLGAIALSLGASIPVYTIDNCFDGRDELGVKYDRNDHQIALDNIKKVSAAVTSFVGECHEEAQYFYKVSLLFWDLGIKGRLKDDIAAWLPKLTDDAMVVVKDLETGEGFGRAELAELGFQQVQAFPEGAVYVYRRSRLALAIEQTIAQQRERKYAIWVVDGDQYVAEAERSAASVKKHMPHLERIIYQPNKREHKEWFVESTRLLVKALENLPQDANVLWLDSDTYMCEPVGDLFEMLDRFDMCLAHAPGHKTAPTVNPIPDAFPEFNIGVIAMRNTDAVRVVWRRVWEKQQSGAYGNNDQAPLREVLWHNTSGVRFAVLPCEYNFRFWFGGQVRDRVKILHGHAASTAEYESIKAQVNAGYEAGFQLPPRLFIPTNGHFTNAFAQTENV